MPELNRVEFFFEDQVVGYFEGDPALTPGEQAYMPYRGPGHLHLMNALSSGPQRCSLVRGEKARFFVVRRAGIHLLEIGE